LFRYLRVTSNHQLKYSNSDTASNITGFVNADWGSEIEDRKSKKQPTVTLSSFENEYMGLYAALQEALWWQG
jgi:hypothetical protein